MESVDKEVDTVVRSSKISLNHGLLSFVVNCYMLKNIHSFFSARQIKKLWICG
ncbi:MAG: hypothetical protein ACI4V0_09925 [Lachnospiraceae bacterium]